MFSRWTRCENKCQIQVHRSLSEYEFHSTLLFGNTLRRLGLWYFSVILWWSVLFVEATWENHRPAASHWQTLSYNGVSSTPRHERDSNPQSCITLCPIHPLKYDIIWPFLRCWFLLLYSCITNWYILYCFNYNFLQTIKSLQDKERKTTEIGVKLQSMHQSVSIAVFGVTLQFVRESPL